MEGLIVWFNGLSVVWSVVVFSLVSMLTGMWLMMWWLQISFLLRYFTWISEARKYGFYNDLFSIHFDACVDVTRFSELLKNNQKLRLMKLMVSREFSVSRTASKANIANGILVVESDMSVYYGTVVALLKTAVEAEHEAKKNET